jgi:hypothetical protein
MKSAKTIIAKIETGHWLLLERDFRGDCTFEIWGVHPLRGRLGPAGEQVVKERACSAAQQHLDNHGLSSGFDERELSWRVAVSQELS